jgi:hypothetical protein
VNKLLPTKEAVSENHLKVKSPMLNKWVLPGDDISVDHETNQSQRTSNLTNGEVAKHKLNVNKMQIDFTQNNQALGGVKFSQTPQ